MITTAPWTTADTGLKEITVYVMWQDTMGAWHDQEMHNLLVNTATNALNSTITGTVTDQLSQPIAGAMSGQTKKITTTKSGRERYSTYV